MILKHWIANDISHSEGEAIIPEAGNEDHGPGTISSEVEEVVLNSEGFHGERFLPGLMKDLLMMGGGSNRINDCLGLAHKVGKVPSSESLSEAAKVLALKLARSRERNLLNRNVSRR